MCVNPKHWHEHDVEIKEALGTVGLELSQAHKQGQGLMFVALKVVWAIDNLHVIIMCQIAFCFSQLFTSDDCVELCSALIKLKNAFNEAKEYGYGNDLVKMLGLRILEL